MDPLLNPDYKTRPHIDRRGIPRARAEWMGDRVCVRYIEHRGHQRRKTAIGYKWGTLVEATRDDQIAVDTKYGRVDIHYRRVTDLWNLSRRIEVA